MPADLSIPDHDRIQVRDSAGTGLPFSRGIMATSILATGLETAHAYRIAAEIQRTLLRTGRREIDTEELAALAEEAIRTDAGARAATRYRAWRQVRHGGRPVVLCLAGAPGVGKSSVATRLALRLGINRVVPTDAIREVLRTVVPDTVLPELHVSTFERIDDATSPGVTPVSFTRQARAVSAATAAVAARMVAEGRSVIVEGVHLLPGDVRARLIDAGSNAVVVEMLLILADESLHERHLARRRHAEPDRDGERHLRAFPVIRLLQEELRRRAAIAGVDEWDVGHPEQLTQRIVDRMVSQFEESACIAATES